MSIAKEGYLLKQGSKVSSNWVKRFYRVQANLLLRYKKKENSNGKNALPNSLDLVGCSIEFDNYIKYGIAITTKDHTVIHLSAFSNEEVSDWVAAMRNAAGIIGSSKPTKTISTTTTTTLSGVSVVQPAKVMVVQTPPEIPKFVPLHNPYFIPVVQQQPQIIQQPVNPYYPYHTQVVQKPPQPQPVNPYIYNIPQSFQQPPPQQQPPPNVYNAPQSQPSYYQPPPQQQQQRPPQSSYPTAPLQQQQQQSSLYPSIQQQLPPSSYPNQSMNTFNNYSNQQPQIPPQQPTGKPMPTYMSTNSNSNLYADFSQYYINRT